MIDEVVAALERAPGRTAVELRDALRGAGMVSVTTADVLRVLTAAPGRFHDDGADPPRWSPGPAAEPENAGPRLGPGGLYAWQAEALAAWHRQGRMGVVEAVTGTGKTRLGVVAALESLDAGGQVLVLVPTRELQHQWHGVLAGELRVGLRVGLRGDCGDGDLGRDDVVIAVVNSAREPLRPRRPNSLLVADECHRYASSSNRLALDPQFPRRLGLTATLERPDGGHIEWLAPYFGRTCFRMGYARAARDGVVARFTVDLLPVRFSPGERDLYEELTERMKVLRAILLSSGAVRSTPVGAFLPDVARLARAEGDLALRARTYLSLAQQRRELLSETPAKTAALDGLHGALRSSQRALVFTQTIQAAERAAAQVRALGLTAAAVHSELSPTARRGVLARFGSGETHVCAAPQVLDEGIDVPAADLAVVLAASQSRRQMTQRMGRVLRRKPDGRVARFVIVFVQDTVEDPRRGAHEGFLDEVRGEGSGRS